jgi:hypothetical protein
MKEFVELIRMVYAIHLNLAPTARNLRKKTRKIKPRQASLEFLAALTSLFGGPHFTFRRPSLHFLAPAPDRSILDQPIKGRRQKIK